MFRWIFIYVSLGVNRFAPSGFSFLEEACNIYRAQKLEFFMVNPYLGGTQCLTGS